METSVRYDDLKMLRNLADMYLKAPITRNEDDELGEIAADFKKTLAMGYMKKKPKHGSPEWHRYRIAKKTVKMPSAMAGVMGGMSKKQAIAVLRSYGEDIDEERGYAKRIKVVISTVRDSALRDLWQLADDAQVSTSGGKPSKYVLDRT